MTDFQQQVQFQMPSPSKIFTPAVTVTVSIDGYRLYAGPLCSRLYCRLSCNFKDRYLQRKNLAIDHLLFHK